MTTVGERYADILNTDDEPDFVHLVTELDTLGDGGPTPRGDMRIQHALTARARELALQRRNQSVSLPEARRRRVRLLPARLSVAIAGSVAILISVGAYLHGQSPTPVSAQTVLHRAASAGPGPNQATHATYHVSSNKSRYGTADVWIGYDGSGKSTQLALSLTMTQGGPAGARLTGKVVETGPDLVQVYRPGAGPGQVPVLGAPDGLAQPPMVRTSPAGTTCVLCGTLKGMVVGTMLAQKLSTQASAYTLHQETLGGTPVYALQYPGTNGFTFYFNAQSYTLEGADWVQDGKSWQTRLDSYNTMALSAVPAQTFGSGSENGRQISTEFTKVGPGHIVTSRRR